jgi:hypothetical protein
MLYYTAAGTAVTQDALMLIKIKNIQVLSCLLPHGITLEVNYKNFDFSVDGYGTSSKVYNGKKAQRFSGENIEESVATDFWTVNNTSSNPAPFNQVPVASTYYLESEISSE